MTQPLKLAIVTPYPPSKTTLNEYGYYLTKSMAQKPEIEKVYLLVEHGQEGYQADSEKVNFVPCWEFNKLSNSLKILKQLRKIKPDTVIINLQFLLFGDKKIAAALGLMLPVLLRLFGIKCIVLLHNIMEEVDLSQAGITKNRFLKFGYNLIGNFLTRCILSANIVGVTIEKYVTILKGKYKKDNIVLLPHGTFEIPSTPDFDKVQSAKKILTFGKFGTYKKVEILIEAFIKLKERDFNELELVIAGSDNPNVKGYLKNVEAQYQHISGIEFTGYVPEEKVSDLFNESTVVVFPYTSTTGSSGVLHQTGSYGKAAVLPNLGDLGRLVKEEGYAGEFFEPEDSESLAEVIRNLLVNDSHRKKVARQNFEAASSLALDDIADWYLIHMYNLKKQY